MNEMLNVWIGCGGGGFQRTDTIRKADVLFQEQALVCGFQIADVIFGKPPALQADQVQAAGAGGIAVDDHEWWHVLHDFRESADDRMFPDPAELMGRGESRDNRVIPDHAVPCQAAVVGKNDVIAKLAVVGDMGVAEKQIVRADPSRKFFMRATVDGAVFAKNIVITYLKRGWLADVFQILSLPTHHCERKKLVLPAESRDALQHHMTVQDTSVSERDVGSDHAVRADADIFSKLCLWRNDGGGMNHLESFKSIDRL